MGVRVIPHSSAAAASSAPAAVTVAVLVVRAGGVVVPERWRWTEAVMNVLEGLTWRNRKKKRGRVQRRRGREVPMVDDDGKKYK